jgi:hypothetical protein
MTRKSSKSTTGWRKRYLVDWDGVVWLVRGKGRKRGKHVYYMIHLYGKWIWHRRLNSKVVDNDAQLAALRLQGVPVQKEPRWKHYL